MPRYSDADAFAAMQDDEARRRIEADARHLSGSEVGKLRRALDAASVALSRINERGLPFAYRQDMIGARAALDEARPIVAPITSPAGSDQVG